MSDRRLSQSELIVSWATLLKILLACLLAVVLFKLWSLLELLFLALLVAITLWPLLEWTTRRGLPKWVGVTLASLVLVCFVVLFLGLLIPAISSQGTAIIESLPRFKENFMGKLPGSGPVRDLANRTMDLASFSDPQPLMKSFITWEVRLCRGSCNSSLS
jgi:predicted PurR-regulated permease PerM